MNDVTVIPSNVKDYTIREMALFERNAGCELGPALTKVGVGGYRATGDLEGIELDLEAYDSKNKPVRSSRILQVLVWIVWLRDDDDAKQDDALDAEYEMAVEDPKDES